MELAWRIFVCFLVKLRILRFVNQDHIGLAVVKLNVDSKLKKGVCAFLLITYRLNNSIHGGVIPDDRDLYGNHLFMIFRM